MGFGRAEVNVSEANGVLEVEVFKTNPSAAPINISIIPMTYLDFGTFQDLPIALQQVIQATPDGAEGKY